MTAPAAKRGNAHIEVPDRGVIDIGSNTVRLVVYSGPKRAPNVWLNEKVTARLGRDLAETGAIPKEAENMALAGLARFAAILRDLGISDITTVATAAARDASNGAKFIKKVRALGLEPRVLSGVEEATISAFGVIGAFPGAKGVVADLGGGSLELVAIEKGDCHDGISLPLGTLRLPAIRESGDEKFAKAIRKQLQPAGFASQQEGPLYLVGGTWRALANYAMHNAQYPIQDPQAFCLTAGEADKVAKKLAKADPDALSSIPGISSNRAAGLPDAAAMLRVMLREFKPEAIVISAWGLREGVLFSALSTIARDQDPLLTAVTHFATPRGADITNATLEAAWTAEAVDGRNRGSERIRLAATMLAAATARIEPNMRIQHSTDWALEKRWVGLDHTGRAMIAQCLRASCAQPKIVPEYLRMADEDQLHRASAWGLANRLCRRIGAGTRISLLSSTLRREGDTLVLRFDESRAHMMADTVETELANLADWLGLKHEMTVGDVNGHSA
ncbi:Ppx/GppA family phosphatase [Aurantiacibacter rhizosphaerae]|uniref:Ppx/GppA family phosphatase n=1 Tax=Aurantiacibacter rhizosphaerae TaxID=2691582 RepID=A0A844XHJ1_9SPHN|nr:Ppx/GppA family phosphatase [Aurantiacibacter rhizosphaerae]MWV29018.1 Ppx/GppA family phosphatase [Aurantiacibacter rhizosphaerae]